MICLLAATVLSSFVNVQVTKVHDGDTFTITIPNIPPVLGYQLPVRINGIDTAEITDERKCARDAAIVARDHLLGLLRSGQVDVLDCERDKFFRLRCRVVVDESQDVADNLLALGLARPYSGEARAPWNCAVAKKKAPGR